MAVRWWSLRRDGVGFVPVSDIVVHNFGDQPISLDAIFMLVFDFGLEAISYTQLSA